MKRLLLILFLFPALAVGQDTLRVDSISLEGTISSDSYSGLLIGDGLLQQFYDTTLIDSVVLRDSTVYDTAWTMASIVIANAALYDVSYRLIFPTDTTDTTYTVAVAAHSLADSLHFQYYLSGGKVVSRYAGVDGVVRDSVQVAQQSSFQLILRAFYDRHVFTIYDTVDPEFNKNLGQ